MGRLVGWTRARQDESGSQERHVEALAIERYEHRSLFDALANAFEHRQLFAQLPNEKLLKDERSVRIPPRQPHEKGDGSRATCEPSGFGVEKENATNRALGERGVKRQEG